MKIFLIGGGGYVGSALVPKVLEEGYEVTVFDLFIYGKKVFSENDIIIRWNRSNWIRLKKIFNMLGRNKGAI